MGQQVFSTAGNFTFTAPVAVFHVDVELWAGGGAGATITGGGGGGGGYASSTEISVTPGNDYDVTVGNGGPAPGAAGGQTFFINAGFLSSLGGNGASVNTGGSGGSGGGDISHNGGKGGNGVGGAGGGGGEAGGPNSNGAGGANGNAGGGGGNSGSGGGIGGNVGNLGTAPGGGGGAGALGMVGRVVVSWTDPTAPTITSFDSDPAPIGGSTFVHGTMFSTTTDVTINGESTTFDIFNDTLLSIDIPGDLTPGTYPVVITNAIGSSDPSPLQVYEIVPPIVTGLTRNTSPAGETTTALGSGFRGTTDVTVNGESTSFSLIDDNSILIFIPGDLDPGTYPIVVINPAGSSDPFDVTVGPANPVIASFNPNPAPAGTDVEVSGNGFLTTTDVTIDGNSIPFSVNDDPSVIISIPGDLTPGTYPVIITNETGSSSPLDIEIFNYSIPIIDSLSRNTAPAGETTTALGSGFLGTNDITVNGESAAWAPSFDDNSIIILIPDDLAPGTYPIIITNPAGSSDPFDVTVGPADPVTTSLTVNPVAAGENTNIIGNGFTTTTDVTLNGDPIEFDVVNDYTITITIPADLAGGTYPIVVTNDTGSSDPINVDVTGGGSPVIDDVTPTTAGPGQNITLIGSGFTGVTDVTVGGVPATFTILSDTAISIIIPLNAPIGTDSIDVDGALFDFNVVPTVNPPSPTGPNEILVITGIGFDGAELVTVNGVPTTFTVLSNTNIQILIPNNSPYGTATVVITVPGGSVTQSIVILPMSQINLNGPFPIAVFKVKLQLLTENPSGIPATKSSFLPNIGDANYVQKNGTYIVVQGQRAFYLKKTYITGRPDDDLTLVAWI